MRRPAPAVAIADPQPRGIFGPREGTAGPAPLPTPRLARPLSTANLRPGKKVVPDHEPPTVESGSDEPELRRSRSISKEAGSGPREDGFAEEAAAMKRSVVAVGCAATLIAS